MWKVARLVRPGIQAHGVILHNNSIRHSFHNIPRQNSICREFIIPVLGNAHSAFLNQQPNLFKSLA